MDKILILDFGGQYKQLIARRVRECNVYCEIHPYTLEIEKIKEMNPKGIILTGGPASVYDGKSPTCPPDLFNLGIPVLGICYGSQLMAYRCGASAVSETKDMDSGTGYACNPEAVRTAPVSEYGRTEVVIDAPDSLLFRDVETRDGTDENGVNTVCWMSHTDYIARIPDGFRITAHTANCPVAAMENPAKKLYAVQFHPEVEHTPEGRKMLRGFVMDVCGCSGDWQMSSFAERTIKELREKIGDSHVLLGLSGGVDSTVAAALLSKAIGDQLHCVFVDHGLMRKNEGDEVEKIFGSRGSFDLQFVRVNARERFFRRLIGQTDPEIKRTIIGEEFPRVFGDEARKLKGKVRYLAQGTIYPDVVESGDGKTGDVIKSHHNVGGLPIEVVRELGFDETPIEPLRMLFKDEVRRVGCSSRMKCAVSVWNWGSPVNWYTASHSPVPVWLSASLAKSHLTKLKSCGRRTTFSEKSCIRQVWTRTWASILPPSPTCTASVSWATTAPTAWLLSSVPSLPATS